MTLLNQTVDLATALKAVGLAAGIGGGFWMLKDDVAYLRDTKADKAEVAVVAPKLDAIDQRLGRIESTLDRMDAKLDHKADKP